MMTLEDVARQLNQTTIRLGIDLDSVRSLAPGEEVSHVADIGPTEVYVVHRDAGNGHVHAYSINADALVIRAENRG